MLRQPKQIDFILYHLTAEYEKEIENNHCTIARFDYHLIIIEFEMNSVLCFCVFLNVRRINFRTLHSILLIDKIIFHQFKYIPDSVSSFQLDTGTNINLY